MNKVMLVGRLTRDPELKTTGNDKKYVRFSVAVDRRFKPKDEGQQTADFPNCVAWDKTAEFIDKYFSKGKRIGLEGRLQTGSYEKDGRKIYTTDVIVENVEFVESKGSGESTETAQPDSDGFINVPDGLDEELPF